MSTLYADVQLATPQFHVFDMVPDFLLLMIMSLVSDQPAWGVPSLITLGQVCRRFCRISRDPVLWHQLALRDLPENIIKEPIILNPGLSLPSLWDPPFVPPRAQQPVPPSPPVHQGPGFCVYWRLVYLKFARLHCIANTATTVRARFLNPATDNHDSDKWRFAWRLKTIGLEHVSAKIVDNLVTLNRLTSLSLLSLDGFVSFGALRLPNLQSLFLYSLNIVDFAPLGLAGRFPNLKEASFHSLPQLVRCDLLPSREQLMTPLMKWKKKICGSTQLKETTLLHLEKLVIEDCPVVTIQEDPDGFSLLTSLQTLRLEWLPSVRWLPPCIGLLKSLKILQLTGLENLWTLGPCLQQLFLEKLELKKLPSLKDESPQILAAFPKPRNRTTHWGPVATYIHYDRNESGFKETEDVPFSKLGDGRSLQFQR